MENSEFGENTDFFALTDIVPLDTNGSTSDTYKVRISGKWHFLKRPRQEFTNHPQYDVAFEKEFDIGYTLDHSNVVRYISKGRDKDGFYFLTEYVDGQTLKDFVSNNPTYFKKKEHIQKFIEQLLSAISYLHQKQILHLDLKPENILITNIGNDVKLIDLGFAYTDCYQFLTTGKTNLYAAPEQINNGKIDQRTDIYGIGMLLLYVFTQSSNKKQLTKIPRPYKSIVSRCLNDIIEGRYFDISSLNKEIIQSPKNKTAKYLLLFFLLLGIGLFFFIKPYLTKESEITSEPTIAVTDITKIDSILTDSVSGKINDNTRRDNTDSTPVTVIAQPVIKEVSADELRPKYKEISKNELSKLFKFKEPVTYSYEEQKRKQKRCYEFHQQWVNAIKDDEFRLEFHYTFWKEYMVIAFPYIREQFLAYLHKAKNQPIPDNITEADDVYRLIDKEMSGKFISFMNEYPIIMTEEEDKKLTKLFREYEDKKDSTYNQYSHLFKNEHEFKIKFYTNRYYDCIYYIGDWENVVDTWRNKPAYRVEDNPYIKFNKLK